MTDETHRKFHAGKYGNEEPTPKPTGHPTPKADVLAPITPGGTSARKIRDKLNEIKDI